MIWFDGGTLGAVFMREEEEMTRPELPDVVAELPPHPWMALLANDALVWLVKEEMYAVVQMRWQGESSPVTGFGRICIRKWTEDNHLLAAEAWISDHMGRGVDRSQLFWPVEGHTHPLMYARPQIHFPDDPQHRQPAKRGSSLTRPARNIRLKKARPDGHSSDCAQSES